MPRSPLPKLLLNAPWLAAWDESIPLRRGCKGRPGVSPYPSSPLRVPVIPYSMGIKRTSHSVYDTCYHLVWCPKRRRDVFRVPEIRERAEQLFREVCEEYGIEVIELAIAVEHVHVMVSFPPKRSIGEVVRILKSRTARELFHEFPELRRRLWSGEVWEDGYFARTVGDRMTSDVIEKYIQHHKDLEQGPKQLNLKLR